jgi:uncharacterized protein YkwD
MPNKIVSMTQRQTANPSYTSHIIILLILSIIGVRLVIFHLGLHQTATASDLTVENIMAAINKERDLRNLALLKTDSRLTQAAQFKSDDMQARHYFSHTNPEGEYIWPKIVEYGYSPYVQLGENLAIEFYNTESLVSAWMNSPTHRANVLQENFKDQGMGLTFGDRQRVQIFLRTAPLNDCQPKSFISLVAKQKRTTNGFCDSHSTPQCAHLCHAYSLTDGTSTTGRCIHKNMGHFVSHTNRQKLALDGRLYAPPRGQMTK